MLRADYATKMPLSGFVLYAVVLSVVVVDEQDFEVTCCAIGLVGEREAIRPCGIVGRLSFTCRPAHNLGRRERDGRRHNRDGDPLELAQYRVPNNRNRDRGLHAFVLESAITPRPNASRL